MRRLVAFLLLQFFIGGLQAKPIEIIFWHSLAGYLGVEVNHLVEGFNKSQEKYAIKAVYKGEYLDTLTSFAAAFRAKQPPAIVQVFEVGTATMLYPQGIIKPLDELMFEQGTTLPKTSFLAAVRASYSKANRLFAMPFNTSIPVIYYNANALAEVGYAEHAFPQTWDEMEDLANKLRKHGYSCAYTSAYAAWIQIEAFSALHGLAMVEGEPARAVYNNSSVIKHLERLKQWQENHLFEYGGRANDATILFTSGRCPLFSQSSGSYKSLAEVVKFRLGVAPLPLDKKISQIRHNNVVGGAALWTVAGRSADLYPGIAQFFSYLAQPEVQQRWHQNTGYLPLGIQGVYASQAKNPILTLAQADLNNQSQPVQYTSAQNQIRTINDAALEMIFAGIKTPKQAIDEAVKKANYALLRFARNTKVCPKQITGHQRTSLC